MRFAFKIAVVVLLSGVLAVSVAGQVLPPPHSAQPAGCHHGGKIPVPQPVNYNCCQAGHNVAILQCPSLHDAALVVFSTSEFAPNLCPVSVPFELRGNLTPFEQPPGNLPLRI
jgi:hypothetical protein